MVTTQEAEAVSGSKGGTGVNCGDARETKLGIWNGRIEKSEQNFCDTELVELKFGFRSKSKSWESLSWKS